MLLLLSNSVRSFLEELWPDGVTNHLLKLSAEDVAQPLSDVYNKSLLEGMFPVCWKTATISPVPKECKQLTIPFYFVALLLSFGKILSVISCCPSVLNTRGYLIPIVDF